MDLQSSCTPLPLSKATLLRKLRLRKHRYQERCFVAEGVRIVAEVLSSPAHVQWLLVSEGEKVRDSLLRVVENACAAGIECYSADAKVFSELSDTSTPQGILALCSLPKLPNEIAGDGCYVSVQGVRDPGNIGSIVRCAWAFGCRAVVVESGVADPFGPKAVRSSMGGIFSVPIISLSLESLMETGISVFVTAVCGGSDYRKVEYPRKFALVLGGEAGGISAHASAFPNAARITIPMPGGAESLNVASAAAILLAHTAASGSAES